MEWKDLDEIFRISPTLYKEFLGGGLRLAGLQGTALVNIILRAR